MAERPCTKCSRTFTPRKPSHVVCSACVLGYIMQICANCGRNTEQDDGDSMCTCTEQERADALEADHE